MRTGHIMTYYEEFGISETASPQEIRQSCENLAQAAAVLLEPDSRDGYDRSLVSLALAVADQPPSATPISSGWRRLAPAGIALAAVILILVLGVPPDRAPLPLYIPRKAAVQTTVQPARAPGPLVEEEWEPLATPGYDSHVALPVVPPPEK